MDISGYQESGDARTGLLNVPNQYVTSVTSTFGTELSYAWSLPFGVVTPRVTGEWVREYANDARVTQALIQGGGSTLIVSNASETDWGNIGAGVLVTLPNGLSAMFNYQSLIMSDAVNHTIEGGVRFEF
jgi:outer membrane lipase/esterase